MSKAPKIWEAFKGELTQPATDDMREALATAFRQLNALCSKSLPPSQDVDEFYARLYGSNEQVVYQGSVKPRRLQCRGSSSSSKRARGIIMNFSKKKIRRRLSYEVSFWYNGNRETKYFHSTKKMRAYVNGLHKITEVDFPSVIIEKTWCYRNHKPRHKWWYESTEPNRFICYERY